MEQEGERMSVGRDVIARASGVSEEEIKCVNCAAYHPPLFCDAWNQFTSVEDFCSFWTAKREKSDD